MARRASGARRRRARAADRAPAPAAGAARPAAARHPRVAATPVKPMSVEDAAHARSRPARDGVRRVPQRRRPTRSASCTGAATATLRPRSSRKLTYQRLHADAHAASARRQRRRPAAQPRPRRSGCRSSCSPAPTGSTRRSPARTSRRPASRSPASTSTSAGPRPDLRRERDPLPREPARPARAHDALRLALTHDFPVRADHRRAYAARRAASIEAERARRAAAADAGRHADARSPSWRRCSRTRWPSARSCTRVLMDVLGLGVLIVGRERHRQERVRARPDRPRPPARGRRHRRGPPARRDDPHRHLPGADAPPHGAARPRRHQRQGAVRHRVDAVVQARRAGRAARALGSRRASTSGSASTTSFYEILGLRVPLIRMPVAPGRNIAILVEVAARNQLLRRAAITRRASWPTGSSGAARRSAAARPTTRRGRSSRRT